MTRADWWLGIALLTGAILVHALFPRYEFIPPDTKAGRAAIVRFDRWTGRVEIAGSVTPWVIYAVIERFSYATRASRQCPSATFIPKRTGFASSCATSLRRSSG